jgi:hypothetical protein
MKALAEVFCFLKNPVSYCREERVRELQKASIPQEEFFKKAERLIYDSAKYSGTLLFYGYDAAFMERESTKSAVKETVGRNFDYWFDAPVVAIVGKDDDYLSHLEWLTREEISIITSPDKIRQGFICYGQIGVSRFDKDQSTYYPAESGKGIIYRDFLPTHFAAKLYSKKFFGEENRLRSMVD